MYICIYTYRLDPHKEMMDQSENYTTRLKSIDTYINSPNHQEHGHCLCRYVVYQSFSCISTEASNSDPQVTIAPIVSRRSGFGGILVTFRKPLVISIPGICVDIYIYICTVASGH